MKEVGGPVVAIAVILAAVFIPVAFTGGITGRLYQQFAITIAISVCFSAFNALTLSPALAALLLKPKKESERIACTVLCAAFNRMFDRFTNGYVKVAGFFARKLIITLIILGGIVVATVMLGKKFLRDLFRKKTRDISSSVRCLPDAASLNAPMVSQKKLKPFSKRFLR